MSYHRTKMFYVGVPHHFQFDLNDFNGRFHLDGYKQFSDIIGGDTFPFLMFYVVDLIYKVFCVLYKVEGIFL